MSTSNLLTAKEQAMVSVIKDNILYSRIYDGMHTILNAYNPHQDDEDLEINYRGIYSVFIFMEIENNDLIDELSDVYHDMESSNTMQNADHLAESIYFEWLKTIKAFYTTKKAS